LRSEEKEKKKKRMAKAENYFFSILRQKIKWKGTKIFFGTCLWH